jgi:hypothetical protein
MTDARSIYARSRRDVAAMLGFALDALTPEQATRLDVATALRVLLDNQSARLVRGESLDARELLMASEALSRLLPPLREPPPAANAPDPRQIMFETYMAMRKRGELADPTSTYEGMKAEVERLRAEVAALKAAGAPAPDEPSATPPAPAAPAPAPASAGNNVVKLSTPRAVDVNALPPAEPEPWRAFVNVDGSIRSQPRGRWDV